MNIPDFFVNAIIIFAGMATMYYVGWLRGKGWFDKFFRNEKKWRSKKYAEKN